MTETDKTEGDEKPADVPENLFKDVKYYVVGDIGKEVHSCIFKVLNGYLKTMLKLIQEIDLVNKHCFSIIFSSKMSISMLTIAFILMPCLSMVISSSKRCIVSPSLFLDVNDWKYYSTLYQI